MTKTVLAYVLILIFIGFGVWLFVRKGDNAPENIIISPSTTPTPPPAGGSENQIIKMDNGLEIQDLKIGTGAEVRSGQALAVNYLGTLADGAKFDSSYDRGEPFQFILGAGDVIQGWDLGLVGMKVGGKRKLIIPPSLGYGSQNIGNGLIPPNSTLIFEVELLAVQDQP